MQTLAFSGSGWIAAVHGLAARANGMPVSHVASRDSSHAKRRADECDAIPCAYDDLPAGADTVVVCTPPFLHAQDVLRALAGGAAAIVEKPLCTTLADADVIVAAAGQNSQRVGYAENLAYAPIVRALVAASAELGRLHHVEARCVQARPKWGSFLTAEWGGGALFDLGVHPLAVVLLLAGADDVIGVAAQLEGGEDHPTDEHAEVTLRFDSGLRGTVVSSWRGHDIPQWNAQAASDTGAVQAELIPAPSLERDGIAVALPTPTAAVPQLEQYGYIGQLSAFAADFDAGRAPFMDATFGRTVLDIVCAAYASAANDGAMEPVPFTGPRDRTPLQLWRG